MYYRPCLAFSSLKITQFENDRFMTRKNAKQQIVKHKNSVYHKSSILSLKVGSETDG